MVDMAHFSGLVAGQGHPNPIEHAHVVTSTTHKVLRGGRGGIILTNREDIIKKINSAVFPGYQGGPLMHIIAAKAVTFHEALQPSFKNYIKSVLANAKILSETLKNNGFKIFSGGTDTHLMLVDLRPFNVTGKAAETSLGTKLIEGLSANPENNSKIESEVKKEVIELCSKFPIYSYLNRN